MAGGGVGTGQDKGNPYSAIQKLDSFFGSLKPNEQHTIANLVRASLQGAGEVQGYGADSFASALTTENAPLLAAAIGLDGDADTLTPQRPK